MPLPLFTSNKGLQSFFAIFSLAVVTAGVLYPIAQHQFLVGQEPRYFLGGIIERLWAKDEPFFYYVDNLLLHILCGSYLFFLLRKLAFSLTVAWVVSLLFLIAPATVDTVGLLSSRQYIVGTVFLFWAGLAFIARRWFFLGFFVLLAVLTVLIKFPAGYPQEPWAYMASGAAAMAVAFLMRRFIGFLKTQEALIRVLFYAGVIVLVLGFALLSYQSARGWHDTLSFWQYRAAVAPHPANYSKLAESYRKFANPLMAKEEIIRLYHKAILLGKEDKALYYCQLGDFYFQLGDYDNALFNYQSALGVDHKLQEAYLGIGEIYQVQGKNAQLIDNYNKLLKLYPDDEDVYIRLIAAYGKAAQHYPQEKLYQEKQEELISSLEQLSTRRGYSALDFFNLAMVYQQVGGKEEAARYYIKSLSLNPRHTPSMLNLARLYQDSGEFKSALSLYGRVLKIEPKQTQAYLNMGIIFNAIGDQTRAKQFYLKVISIDPDHANAYFHLGYLSEQKGEGQEAVNFYEKAIELDPTNAEAYYNLGNVYAKLGQTPEAIAVYLKTVTYNPLHQDAFVNLSILSFKAHDFQGAIAYLDKAMRLGYAPPQEYIRTLEPYKKR